ncbi:hypothetical protein TeGR_g9486, partial [Tetraparma gracilis]
SFVSAVKEDLDVGTLKDVMTSLLVDISTAHGVESVAGFGNGNEQVGVSAFTRLWQFAYGASSAIPSNLEHRIRSFQLALLATGGKTGLFIGLPLKSTAAALSCASELASQPAAVGMWRGPSSPASLSTSLSASSPSSAASASSVPPLRSLLCSLSESAKKKKKKKGKGEAQAEPDVDAERAARAAEYSLMAELD